MKKHRKTQQAIKVHLTVPIRLFVNVLRSNRSEASGSTCRQDGRDGGESHGQRVIKGKKEEGGEGSGWIISGMTASPIRCLC